MVAVNTKPLSELIKMQLNSDDPAPLNSSEIRNYIYYGFHDDNLRSNYWKVLMNYYNPNKGKARVFYNEHRKDYHEINIPNDERIEKFHKFLKADMSNLKNKIGEIEVYREPLENILLKFAATHPNENYVKGMVALSVPIFHVMSAYGSFEDKKYAEEDTFYLFQYLMEKYYLPLCDLADDAPEGIKKTVKSVYQVIKAKSPVLYDKLLEKDVLSAAFPVKWILQLFTEIYSLENSSILYLWDKILSDSYRFEIVVYLSAARVLYEEDRLLEIDSSRCLELLDKPCSIPPEKLFLLADELRRTNSPAKEILKLEKLQINL